MAERNSRLNVSRLIDVAVKKEEVSVETSFLEDFKYCVEKLNKQTHNPSPYYKPSSLHCIRNMYYQRTDTPIDNAPVSADLAGIGESGTDRHLRIQYYVSKMAEQGIDCEWIDVETFIKKHNLIDLEIVEKGDFETKLFNKKYQFRFMCDGLIKYKGKYYILEIKTESSFKWMSRQGVDPKHFEQAIAYSLNFGLDKVLFIYENRDVCSKKSYMFTATETDRQALINKLTTCESYVQQHIVPAKPVDIKASICQYCDYKSSCRKDR